MPPPPPQQYPQGIDFQQALAILSSRSDNNSEDSKHDACPCHAPPGNAANMPVMGQVIDLHAEGKNDGDGTTTAAASSDAATQQAQQKQHLFLASLGPMSTRQLLQAVVQAQQQRVATYREYDRGLQAVLATNNVAYYPTVCTEATAAFSVVSDAFQALTRELGSRDNGKEYVATVRRLQTQEQTKLQYTAALHLEQIRLHQAMDGDATKPLLQQSVAALQSKLSTCVTDINEALEEIQCLLVDASTDDGAKD